MLRIAVIVTIALLGSLSSRAQLTTDADFKRQVYERAHSFGLNFHSRGYAANFRYSKFVDGYTLRGFEIELTKLRHPKEVLTSNDVFGNTRGFVVGRTNSFYSLRLGIVQENILFDKTDKSTVSIAWVNAGGLSLGLLKPIYLQVQRLGPQDNEPFLSIERYEGGLPPGNIRGEANFLKGFNEIALRPGIYYKSGVAFDYQLMDDRITSLEVGVAYDYFFADVPIFYDPDKNINWSGFFQIYLSVNFGTKKA